MYGQTPTGPTFGAYPTAAASPSKFGAQPPSFGHATPAQWSSPSHMPSNDDRHAQKPVKDPLLATIK